MAETIEMGTVKELLEKMVQESGASVEIWEDENDNSQRLAVKCGDLGIELRLLNSKACSWEKTLPDFLEKVKSGATFEELLAFADANKLEVAGEKANKYAVARKDIKETSFHKKYQDNTTLETIYIMDTATLIEDDAFANFKALQTVVIGSGITNIPYECFYGCEVLSKIIIPSSVEEIFRGRTFGLCKKLSQIEFKGTISEWKSVKNMYDMLSCVPAKDVKCSDGVYEKPAMLIENGEVTQCIDYYAENIIIPDGVTKISGGIATGAFSNNDSIVSVELPKSLTEIGGCAFSKCKALEKIEFKGSVAQWEAVKKEKYWNENIPARSVKCSDGDVAL